MPALDEFFNKLWTQYTDITPQALAIHELLNQHEQNLVNDHVAFRTFANSAYSIPQMESELIALGFSVFDEYHFEKKKLYARSYIHKNCPTKIFLSELLWKKLNRDSQAIIEGILADGTRNEKVNLSSGRLWELPSFQDYNTLLRDSEYAAWLSIWGLRANHFTIYINYLTQFSSLESVVDLLKEQHFSMNEEGGVIKGEPEDFLIQASTMADRQVVEFKDAGQQQVSSCYYEFAQRFNQPDGNLYQGFVPSSADKIFESTNNKISEK